MKEKSNTKQQKAVAFKVSDEFYKQLSDCAKDLGENVSEFIKKAIEQRINPQIEVPVEKVVEKEVEKIVYVTKDGEFRGDKTIDLYQRVFDEFMKKKMPEISLTDYVNNWIWESMERTRAYYEKKNGTPQNSTQNANAFAESQKRVMYWNKQISETEGWDIEGQQQNQEGIESDPLLLEKDKAQFRKGNRKR